MVGVIRPFLGSGYHNATLSTTGIAVAIPVAATGADIQVDVGCYVGVRDTNTLATFNDTNYGSTLYGGRFTHQRLGAGAEDYIHIAPWSGTAQVAISFF
jgi:hypothetical protein